LTIIEDKSAYPYITTFKKEPFKSYAQVKRNEIGDFYLSEHEGVIEFFTYYKENLFLENSLNLENVYWFLLLCTYLKEDIAELQDDLYNFIGKCEVIVGDKIGFNFSPNSQQKQPDIWSTYFALASLKLLNFLSVYLRSKGEVNVRKGLLNFVQTHRTDTGYLHCHDKNCKIDNKTSIERTLYFILEIFILLNVEVRSNKEKVLGYIGDIKKDPSLVFKLLCLKFIDLDSNVKDKDIQYLYQFQKENKGFSFKKLEGRINTTFWIVYALDNYSWILDYNPIGIYSFITSQLHEIVSDGGNKTVIKLMELSKLIILLSIIWKKFIQEIERVIFKQIEQEKYIDLNQIESSFGLAHGIQDVISYINLNYTFNLRILNNQIEFKNYLRNLSHGKRVIAREIYENISSKSIVSLSDIFKRYKRSHHHEPLKIKEDVFPLVKDMMDRNYFKGTIRARRRLSLGKRYYIYLNFFLDKIIVSDTDLKLEQLLIEKEKLSELKNTIYNMILKLKTVTLKTREEIESYLLIDEIDIAKDRIKYLIHNTLLDAEFLNENIELSFNEDLYYINLQEVLTPEINRWKKEYSILKNKLKDLELNLQAKIEEKEELRSLNKVLDTLKEKIENIDVDITRKSNNFKTFFREILEKDYSDDKFNLLTQELDRISQRVKKYDTIIYRVSQQITTDERKLKKKHKKVIEHWLSIKNEFDAVFSYYTNGFEFFHVNLKKIEEINESTKNEIEKISEKVKQEISENQFEIQKVFDDIKKDSDTLLSEKMKTIKELQKMVKKETKSNQKMYLLYRYLPEKLEHLEENTLELVSEQVQTLKNKAVEERNRAINEDFDTFVLEEMIKIRTKLINYKKELEESKNLKIKDIDKGFDSILNLFKETNRQYKKKLENCKQRIQNFEEKSNLTIIQWENFEEYLNNEIKNLREENIINIIIARINLMSDEKKTNNIALVDLKKDLNLSCKVLISKIKDMIEISKINAELYEDKKCVLVFTEHYYKNKELRNFIDNKIIKHDGEKIGKILALYDSSIKNRTLGVNTLELQNRIDDLANFEDSALIQYKDKVKELQINISRREYIQTKKYFESNLQNQSLTINNMRTNLSFFRNKEISIDQKYQKLEVELKQRFSRLFEEKEKSDSHIKIREEFRVINEKFQRRVRQTQDEIEAELKLSLNKNYETKKLDPEIREFYVRKKKEFLYTYDKKVESIKEQIDNIKNDSFRGELLKTFNDNKIHLSQLLGNLERRVEDDVEVKEYRRAYKKIYERAADIEDKIKDINKEINNLVKSFNKQSKDFETKNRYVIDDFENFTSGFIEILSEKVKALERLILKSYIETTINAVANEFLTISFLNEELKIKKKNIQEAILLLISSGELKGKYNIRLGVYYEDPNVLNNVDEEELEVIKKMNFRVFMFLTHIKNFTSQYASIIAFFASILTITYTLLMLTGNIIVALIPLLLTIIFMMYLYLKKRKETKIK